MPELYQSLSHSKMGLQIPRSVRTETPTESDLRPNTSSAWVRFSTRWLGKKSARSSKAT